MIFFRSNSMNVSSVGNSNSNTITINGVKHNLPEGNVSINNGKIYVNNVLWNGSEVLNENCKPLEIIIQGNCTGMKDIRGSVTVKGSVEGDIECNGSFTGTSVSRSVSCGGSFHGENVGGNVSAGGSVKCGTVKGNISAGGSVRHG